MESMNAHLEFSRFALRSLAALALLAVPASQLAAEPAPAVVARYDAYVEGVEQRLERQHGSGSGFLPRPEVATRLRRGEEVITRQDSGGASPSGAMLHHWRAQAFVPGAHAAQLERLLRDVAAYPRVYAPEVERARATAVLGDRMHTAMRVRQKHVLTVVLDTDYDVAFGRLDDGHGWSRSQSTRIAEIADAGTPQERVLGPGEDHGFLWRQQTWWSWAEADGGLYLDVESVSLSRAIPTGLGWAVRPFVESVPRDSLTFTLRATATALHKEAR